MLSQEQQNKLIQTLAQNAVFDGWSDGSLSQAAIEIGLDPVFAIEAFPTVPDRVLAHSRLSDESLQQWVDNGGLEGQEGVRGCLHALIMQRFKAYEPVKLAIQKGMSHLTSPLAVPGVTSATWQTMDRMWQLTAKTLGQTDQDGRFDYVSKRTLLTGVYGTSLIAWFDDQSEDLVKTDEFVRARLDNVVGVFGFLGKSRARLRQVFGR